MQELDNGVFNASFNVEFEVITKLWNVSTEWLCNFHNYLSHLLIIDYRHLETFNDLQWQKEKNLLHPTQIHLVWQF